ncbi:PhnD/SsuA/transferrin family substrate-binding protein [Rhizobium sp. CFBP 13726]|uniref:phosphate/phosphite/phosphonate ABC transporter substrate-binding protein n=1 Tax=Rhizobium sp. CFBP 13726 TaxID=2775296 RepID=UPI00177D8448|nr:PhnD/SsuA/transferrin family substrate-binding protein [Rhizobium sp. CFBP 13726]MBD8650828.1 PhnD/SsuA/transferrin family substrate-binding protein [Rhizobium sp. CFBP 13726]
MDSPARLASLAMYVGPPAVAQATDALWAFVARRLTDAGMAGVPDRLDRSISHDDAWPLPDLLLSQTCGYPYVSSLRGNVRLVATPCYDYPGCSGPDMCSFVIVRRDAGISSLEDLRGRTAAINSPDSNSGANLFRAVIALIARGPLFFGKVIETGGHAASIAAVAEGRADCAAIDCITYGHVARFAPDDLADIVVVAETPSGPGLPLITRASASDDEVALLREALEAALVEPSLADVRDVLALSGFAVLDDSRYERLLELERQAEALGYPAVA